MSDETTSLMQRDRLVDLVQATAQPEVSPHTVPRTLIAHRLGAHFDEDDDYASVSPVAVLLVLGLLLAVFVSIATL